MSVQDNKNDNEQLHSTLLTVGSTQLQNNGVKDQEVLREEEKASKSLQNLSEELFKIQHELKISKINLKRTTVDLEEIKALLQESRLDLQQSIIEVRQSKLEATEIAIDARAVSTQNQQIINSLNNRLDQLVELYRFKKLGDSSSKFIQEVASSYCLTAKRDFVSVSYTDDNEEQESSELQESEDSINSIRVKKGEKGKRRKLGVSEIRVGMGSDTAIAEGAIADTAIDNSILEKNDTGEISQDWQGIIHYSLAKEVTTVRGIWVEYVKGINGGPPVKFLEEKFNHRWRLKNQSSTYNRRKRIYKAIEYAINVLKLNEEDVIEELEKYRYDPIEQKKRPMYWLYDNIPSKFKPNFLTTTTTNN